MGFVKAGFHCNQNEYDTASLHFTSIAWLIARCHMSAHLEFRRSYSIKRKIIALFRTRVSLLFHLVLKYSFFLLMRTPGREKINIFAEIKGQT